MAITYATYSEYTAVYSLKGLSVEAVNSTWLPYGALRVNEALGGYFTVPFSTNNQTARDLSIHYARLGQLERTRNQDDSQELLESINSRITMIQCGNAPMITDSGDAFFADASATADAWSTTQDYKPLFDMRDPLDQRVDPDLIDSLWGDDV